MWKRIEILLHYASSVLVQPGFLVVLQTHPRLSLERYDPV